MKINVNPTSRSLGATHSPKPFSTHLLTLPKHLVMLILMTLTTTHAWAISGEGTSTNPFKIYDASDLRYFSQFVNTLNAGAWAELHDNIDDLGGWTPIGTSSRPYTGTFDGRGHSISDMNIQTYTSSYQGFFGCIENATVKNFSLSGSMTSGKTIGNESDTSRGSATVVGSALGSSLVENVSSSVNWDISNATQTHLGGIVGNLSGTTTVRGCTYTGTMNAGQSKDCLGGIVGYAKPSCATSIINCFFSGKISTSPDKSIAPVIGGILGYISDGSGVFGGIRGCYSCGTLSAGEAQTTYVSGIIGLAKNKSIHDNNVCNNYYLSGTASRAIVVESGASFDATTNKAITISVKPNYTSWGSAGFYYVNPTATTLTQIEVYAYSTNSNCSFNRWSDKGAQNHRVTVNGNINLTAIFDGVQVVNEGNTLKFWFIGQKYGVTTYSLPSGGIPDWCVPLREVIYNIHFDKSFRNYRPTNCSKLFYDLYNVEKIEGLEYINTSQVTNMSGMFFNVGCEKKALKSLTINKFDTSNVTDMSDMFNRFYANSLELRNFDTRNVTNMSNMFCNSNIQKLTIDKFDMSKVTDATDMFLSCHNLDTLVLRSIPYLKDGTFNTKFRGKTVYCILDANSTVYEGTNYLPEITNCNHYFYNQNPTDDGICSICHKQAPKDGYCEISDADQLLWYLNNAENKMITSNARLMNDIVINDGTFDANGNYTKGKSGRQLEKGFMTGNGLQNATFDGNNHAIVGLYGISDAECGLFATMDKAMVKNLTLKNCYLKSTGDHVGAIGGYAYQSEISNCYATDCHIEGEDNVGGIVGELVGESTITRCGSNSTVKGNKCIGGICGLVSCTGEVVRYDLTYESCNVLEIRPFTLTNCYATGTVVGKLDYVGGICGLERNFVDDFQVFDRTIVLPGNLSNCIFTGQVTEGGKGICGSIYDANQVTLCYTTVADTGADSQDRCVEGKVSLDRFKSGEIAWLLNGSVPVAVSYDDQFVKHTTIGEWQPGSTDGTQTWYQKIGTDVTPRFEGPTVFYDKDKAFYYNPKGYDLNNDGKITIADFTLLIDALRKGTTTPDMDVDGKPGVNINDAKALANLILNLPI